MAYKYFTKELLEKSNDIDLANIFSEKQLKAKEMLNTNYSLPQIVGWIKDNTNNFKSQQNYLIDLDQAIKVLVYRYYDSTNTPNPFIDSKVEEIESGKQPRVPVEIGGTGKVDDVVVDKVVAVQDEIEQLKEAIAYLQDEADAGDEEAKEALEYIKEELSSLSNQI